MTPTVIGVSGLLFEYPGVRALRDVSFDIPEGSITALVGPNGAGKTTLMRCLAGLERPIAGAIRVAGTDVIEEPRQSHRQMGYLSDFFGLYQELTVRQCLSWAARAQGVAQADCDKVVADVAAKLGLADRLHQAAGSLSRGLRQRLAIGQAIAHGPRVLILDEPAAGLDPEARHSLAALFRALRDGGMTLLISSHILAELDEYSTHMLVLREGRVIEFKALHETGEGLTRVEIESAEDVADWPAVLGTEIRIVSSDARHVTVEAPAEGNRLAAMLKHVIESGVPVIRFTEARENLHASYLRTVEADRDGGKA